jgi:hypothetical protein
MRKESFSQPLIQSPTQVRFEITIYIRLCRAILDYVEYQLLVNVYCSQRLFRVTSGHHTARAPMSAFAAISHVNRLPRPWCKWISSRL